MSSQIEQIDLGRCFIRTCTQGSRVVVVCFEGGGKRALRPKAPAFGFAQEILEAAGFDSIHVLPKKMDWYQSRQIIKFLKAMRDTGFFSEYDQVVTYGDSMGGFAALAFASSVGAHRAIALQPRTTLINSQAEWRSRASSKIEIRRRGAFSDAVNGLDQHTEAVIFFDPLHRRDSVHAKRVARVHANTQLIKVPLAVHGVPALLAQAGLLKSTAISLITGVFDKHAFYKHLRNRRITPQYQKGLRKALMKRRRRNEKRSGRGET